MNKYCSKYQVGQWVQLDEGLGQVLYVRPTYVEKYTTEYFEGSKVGEFIDDIVVCKLLCDFSGKIKKRNRIIAVHSQYCEEFTIKYDQMISKIKKEQAQEYRKYIIYDEKYDIGGIVEIEFKLPQQAIVSVRKEVDEIIKNLPKSFTFKEFLTLSKKYNLSLNFNDCKKYTPGAGLNFSLIFFCHLYKTIDKERIYTSLRYRTK